MSTVTESTRAEALETLAQSLRSMLAAVRRLKGRETHRPGELSFAQYGLLFGLSLKEPQSARDLACSADLSAATVTQMLDHLAAAGLVERTRSEADKRVVLTALTDKGRGLVAERRARYEPRWRAALEEFSEAELLLASRVFERLRANFEALHADN